MLNGSRVVNVKVTWKPWQGLWGIFRERSSRRQRTPWVGVEPLGWGPSQDRTLSFCLSSQTFWSEAAAGRQHPQPWGSSSQVCSLKGAALPSIPSLLWPCRGLLSTAEYTKLANGPVEAFCCWTAEFCSRCVLRAQMGPPWKMCTAV